MKKTLIIALFLAVWTVLPIAAQEDVNTRIKGYAESYSVTLDAKSRIRLANDFFAYLRKIDYLDEPIVFPANAHTDSIDVNVYFYIAEWYYGEGQYATAADYCNRAAQACSDKVDDNSKSDVYSLMGAAYFRLSEFDKAADALHTCYEIDSRGDDYDKLSSTLNNIASVFVAAGKPQEAEKYILEAIAANSLTQNLARRAVLFGTASEMYRAMGDEEQALTYAVRALDIERERGDSAKIGMRLSQMANAELGLSRIDEAQRTLEEAMPLLQASDNKHSLGICMNQMGDILASKGMDSEAADYYREAAALFFAQGDMYNESHAQEGMYKTLKHSAPNEAMLHLERTKILRDSIYQKHTGETISRYNALYYNDLLQKETQRAEQKRHIVMWIAIALSAILALLCVGGWATYIRNKRKVRKYEQNIHSLQNQYDEISRLYRNIAIESLPNLNILTDNDRVFIEELTQAIDEEMEKGHSDLKSVSAHMNTTEQTLRRRLTKTLGVTPLAYFTQVRMKKAKYLLLNYRDVTIAEVAERCGYTLMTNFTRAFTHFYGIKPSEVRLQKPDAEFTSSEEWQQNRKDQSFHNPVGDA